MAIFSLPCYTLSNNIERTSDFSVSRSHAFAPLIASCPIDGGACTASNWDSTPLQEKYLPNRLQDLQKTDAFKPQYFDPYNDALINIETNNALGTPPTNDYDSNCQFGVCLPGVEPGGNILE